MRDQNKMVEEEWKGGGVKVRVRDVVFDHTEFDKSLGTG